MSFLYSVFAAYLQAMLLVCLLFAGAARAADNPWAPAAPARAEDLVLVDSAPVAPAVWYSSVTVTPITWLGSVATGNDDPYFGNVVWWPGYQLGLRADGLVVWRKREAPHAQ